MAAETDNELSVDTAISLVLEAERDALAEIEQCEERADQIMRETRQVIRAMVRRTEERISRLHAGCATRNRELIAELEHAALAGESQPDSAASSEDRLVAAVDAAARRLTTLEPDGVD
jgi:vacuolar-type H+-ATPase subunit H